MAHLDQTRLAILALVIGTFFVASRSNADEVGGFEFSSNAFADNIVSFSPGVDLINSNTIEEALFGSDTSTGISYFNALPGSIELSFDDNLVVNGLGDDIVVFEFGSNEDSIIVSSPQAEIATTITSFDTGFDSGFGSFPLFAATLDLSDLGVSANGTISTLQLSFFDADGDGLSFTPSAVGALHTSIPEPSAGVLGVVFLALSLTHSRRTKC